MDQLKKEFFLGYILGINQHGFTVRRLIVYKESEFTLGEMDDIAAF